MKINITYRRAALEKVFLIAVALALAVWILNAQTVEINPHDPDTRTVVFTKISPAEVYARLCEEDEALHASIEPSAAPMNAERDRVGRELQYPPCYRLSARQLAKLDWHGSDPDGPCYDSKEQRDNVVRNLK